MPWTASRATFWNIRNDILLMSIVKAVWAVLWRVLSAIILIPVIAVALAAAILYVPPVQHRAVCLAENILKGKTGLDASIRRISITPLVNLDLHGISMLDADRDTILLAEDLILKTDLHSITDGVTRIKRLRLRKLSADSKYLLQGIRLRGNVDRLDVISDSSSFFNAYTNVNELAVKGADLTIDLPQKSRDTTRASSSFQWIFDIRRASVKDAKVRLNPIDIDVEASELQLSGMMDIGKGGYHAESFESGPVSVGVKGKRYSIDEAHMVAFMDSTFIRADEVRIRRGGLKADASATLDLKDIQSLAYSADVDMGWIALPDIIPFDIPVRTKGRLSVAGHGFDINDSRTEINLTANLDSCIVGALSAGRTALKANAGGKMISGRLKTKASYADTSIFALLSGGMKFNMENIPSGHPSIYVDADLDSLSVRKDSVELNLDTLIVDAATRIGKTDFSAVTDGFSLKMDSPQHLMDIFSSLDRSAAAVRRQVNSVDVDFPDIRKHLPEIKAKVDVAKDNPAGEILSRYGISFESLGLDGYMSPRQGITASLSTREIAIDTLTLHSVDIHLSQPDNDLLCRVDADFPSQHGLPDIIAGLDATLSSHSAKARLKVNSDIRNGLLDARDLSTGLGLDLEASLDSSMLKADGILVLDSLKYASADFGRRTITFGGNSEDAKHFNLFADTDNIPLSVVGSFVDLGDVSLGGEALAKVVAKGPLDSLEFSGEVHPNGITVAYAPLDAKFALGNVPIRLDDGVVRIDSLPIFAADSTSMIVDGTCDLTDLSLNVRARSDRFKPLPLEKKDSIPYFGNVTAGLDVALTGTPDSLEFSGDVALLPETELTCYIDRTNYVHAKPSGKVRVDFPAGKELLLNGRIDVREGVIMYSPPYYPLMPFTIDPGSFVAFNGPLEDMDLNVCATQPARAIVGDGSDRTREVDFIVGVRLCNTLKNLGLNFTLEAPRDGAIQKEINGFSPEDRDRIAAALLATGMYVSETNTALAQSGYAMTSILQRSANALADNKLGKFVDVSFGAGQSTRNGVLSTDYSMSLSKSLFDDRLRLTVGGRVSDMGGGGNKSQSAIDNISIDWKVKKGAKTTLTLFHKKDYENILDGELDKDGIGVKTNFEVLSKKDSCNPFIFDMEGNLSYRSNSQIGPNLSATMSKYNLLGLDEVFSAKLFGAYYWKTANRSKGGASNNDNFNIGLETAASFQKIIFPGFTRKEFDLPVSTTFNLGYMFENIASGYLLNKFSLGASYGFRTSKYISHSISPVSWTRVLTMGDLDFYQKFQSTDYLIKTLADNTNTLAVRYNFRFSNAFEPDRDVTTRFDAGVAESAILMNSLIKSKPFDEFVKVTGELRNRFRLSEKTSLATRLYAGAAFPVCGSYGAPLADLFYIAGPNSIRAFAPRSIGPGEFHSDKYSMYMYHSGELKFEANAEYRFPLFWMLEGAVFVDAGNVWNTRSLRERLTPEELAELEEFMGIPLNFDDGIKLGKMFNQVALGSGLGVRFVFQSIVARLDLGIAIHAPYDTGKAGYYNIPHFFKDGMRLNFGIGYPF